MIGMSLVDAMLHMLAGSDRAGEKIIRVAETNGGLLYLEWYAQQAWCHGLDKDALEVFLSDHVTRERLRKLQRDGLAGGGQGRSPEENEQSAKNIATAGLVAVIALFAASMLSGCRWPEADEQDLNILMPGQVHQKRKPTKGEIAAKEGKPLAAPLDVQAEMERNRKERLPACQEIALRDKNTF